MMIGHALYFRVIGRTTGAIWGTNLYTTDSDLGTAVVHAGVLRNAQEGIVKVVMLPGVESYPGSARHGVSSASWGSWTGSYRVEVVK
jgi:LCCL domain